MQQDGSSRRHRVGSGAVVAVLVMLVALLGPVGTAPAQAAGTLTISGVTVECECGGTGYVWGWTSVAVSFKGAREGSTYKVVVNGDKTYDAYAYGGTGSAYISRQQGGFKVGKTYRFRIQEFHGKRLMRTTAAWRYTIPTPVVGPDRVHIDTFSRDGENTMIAGQTYRITFTGGQWAKGLRYASGVDAYFGIEDGDDRFGWYQDEDYPLPWKTNGAEPILEFTPTADFIGTRWNFKFIGYRVATKTDKAAGLTKGKPIPGSEWGFYFTANVLAE
jgi:hypothetical protein